MALDLYARLCAYLMPLVLLFIGFLSTIRSIFEVAILEQRPLSFNEWRRRAFKRTWRIAGPFFINHDGPHVKFVVRQAYGTVLDISPGKGLSIRYLDRSKITRVFGVEPDTNMHAPLRAEIEKYKLGDIYTILSSDVENLLISLGSIDSVICVRALCSISKPTQSIKLLYNMLKPGGQMLVYEHCAVPEHRVLSIAGILQALYNIPWPIMLGGCELTRKTDEWLRDAGEWDSSELEGQEGETEYEVVPNVVGKLVKAT